MASLVKIEQLGDSLNVECVKKYGTPNFEDYIALALANTVKDTDTLRTMYCEFVLFGKLSKLYKNLGVNNHEDRAYYTVANTCREVLVMNQHLDDETMAKLTDSVFDAISKKIEQRYTDNECSCVICTIIRELDVSN